LGHPGKKLLFMGGEFGQWRAEPRSQPRLAPVDDPSHAALRRYTKDLNGLYRSAGAYQCDFDPSAFADRLQRQREQCVLDRPLRATTTTSS
jgi:1,4-alpha-glucan branching enzyme